MTQRKDCKYKFEKNLLSLSYEKENIEIAKNEWNIISDEIKINCSNNTCICQRVIKYKHFLINTKTFHTIIVGTNCLKKFNMNNNNKIKNTFIKKYFNSYKNVAIYNSIYDIIKYSYDVKNDLIKHLYYEYLYEFYKYNYNIEKYNEVNDFYQEIKFLNLNFLNNFYLEFTVFINEYKMIYCLTKKLDNSKLKNYELIKIIKLNINQNINNLIVGNEDEILSYIIKNIDIEVYKNIFSNFNKIIYELMENKNDIFILVNEFNINDLKDLYNDLNKKCIDEINKIKNSSLQISKINENNINHDYNENINKDIKKNMKINNFNFNQTYYEGLIDDSLKILIECFINKNNIIDKCELYGNRNFEEYLTLLINEIKCNNSVDIIKIEQMYNIKIIISHKNKIKNKTLNDFFKPSLKV